MSTRNWLIYGANGYTAHLLAEEAVRQGLTRFSPDATRPVCRHWPPGSASAPGFST